MTEGLINNPCRNKRKSFAAETKAERKCIGRCFLNFIKKFSFLKQTYNRYRNISFSERHESKSWQNKMLILYKNCAGADFMKAMCRTTAQPCGHLLNYIHLFWSQLLTLTGIYKNVLELSLFSSLL